MFYSKQKKKLHAFQYGRTQKIFLLNIITLESKNKSKVQLQATWTILMIIIPHSSENYTWGKFIAYNAFIIKEARFQINR